MALVQHEGRVVPWVAIWSAERSGPTMLIDDQGRLAPTPETRHLVRREHGMWMINTPDQREGEPDFGSTHSRRQRDCMNRLLCQVCGEHVKDQMRWVIPDGGEHAVLWKEGLVLNPPVCVSCLEMAELACPHLRETEPLAVLPARHPAPVRAITGDLFLAGRGFVRNVLLPIDYEGRDLMMGRELVVELILIPTYRKDPT